MSHLAHTAFAIFMFILYISLFLGGMAEAWKAVKDGDWGEAAIYLGVAIFAPVVVHTMLG